MSELLIWLLVNAAVCGIVVLLVWLYFWYDNYRHRQECRARWESFMVDHRREWDAYKREQQT